jgi:aldose 1-epimerase
MGVRREPFGSTADGRRIWCFVLDDGQGSEARVLTWGATLASLRVPAPDGTVGEVVLGFDDIRGYLGEHPHLGGIVGRCANRLAEGRFSLDGVEVVLDRNEGAHHLHGGRIGFDRQRWEAEPDEGANGVRLRLVSPDGDQRYPGRLEVSVDYTMPAPGELRIDYRARTDRTTIVNLTNHSYFNLRDGGGSRVLDHELWIDADRFTPLDHDGIPTGDTAAVAGTALDFRQPRRLGDRIHELPEPVGGYDHNFIVRADDGTPVARLHDPVSGRTMTVRTTQPGLQVYTGNRLDGRVSGRGGVDYHRWHAICLETQHWPDAPHHPAFPSTVLRPEQEYRHTTVFAFS